METKSDNSCLIGFFTAQASATGEQADSTHSSAQLRNYIIWNSLFVQEGEFRSFFCSLKTNCVSEAEAERHRGRCAQCMARSRKFLPFNPLVDSCSLDCFTWVTVASLHGVSSSVTWRKLLPILCVSGILMNVFKVLSFSSSTQRMPTQSANLLSALRDSLALMGLRNSSPPPPPRPTKSSFNNKEKQQQKFINILSTEVLPLAEDLKQII